MIWAIASHDPVAIRSVIHPRRMQCSYISDMGGPPLCEEGESEATLVDSMVTAGCEGSWARPNFDQLAADLATEPLELYLATTNHYSDYWTGELVYATNPDEPAFLLWLDDRGIGGFARLGCSTPAEWAPWSHVILRGPASPEDDAP